MTDLRAVPYEPSRRDDVWRLMEDVWGEYTTQEDFDWWFDRNPAGPRLYTLAEDGGGRLGGVLAMSFERMVVGGREVLGAVALHGATHSDFRGRGIFQLLNHVNEEESRKQGAELLFGFTNASAGPIYIARLEWLDVAAPRYWACPLRPARALRSMCSGATRGGGVRRDPGPSAVDSFDASAEATWREAAPALGSHFARDLSYLRWRYAESPRGYRILRLGRSWAVVGHKVHNGVSAGFLADLIAPPGSFREVRALVRQALHEVDADVFLTLPPRPPAQRRALASLGFVPTPQTVRVIARSLDPALAVPTATRDWHFMLGDTDFF